MNDDRKKEMVGRCIYCSAPDDDEYEKLQVFCRNYLMAHPDTPVHLYLDQDIVASYGVKNYNELKTELETINSADTSADKEVREIKRHTLERIVDENINCGLNVIALGTDSFWGKEGLEKDWKPACNPEAIIEEFGKIIEASKKFSPAVKEECLKMRDGTPMVVMVAGCPGSGKSTVGKKISHEMKIAFIDKDTVAREISEKAIELQKSYEGDYETNAYGKSIRTAQYKDMGLIAAVNLELKRSVLITAPFNGQVEDILDDKDIPSDGKRIAKLLHLDPNAPESMKWPNDGDAVHDVMADSSRGDKDDWKIGLYFVWVETSREVELSRLFARDAKRDSWKLAHWISHAKRQNDSHVLTKLKGLDSKRHSIFYNEYDDDMDSEVETTVKKITAFKFSGPPGCQDKNDKGKDDPSHDKNDEGTGKEGKGDFARAVEVILGTNERLDCYCADFEPLKVISVAVKETAKAVEAEVNRYCWFCKLRKDGKFYHLEDNTKDKKGNHDEDGKKDKKNDGMPHVLVVRGKNIHRKVDMDFLSKCLHVNEDGKLINADGESTVGNEIPKIDQLIFEGCTFKRAVSLKRLRFDIAFNNCRFEDSMLIFNRQDTVFATSSCGNSSRNAILIFRCTAIDDCTISEASADVSIVDSELRDVRFNHVEFDKISIYGSTMNTLEVSANCKVCEDEKVKDGKVKDGCCFWLRDTRIQDAVLLPNVSFDKMNLNGSIINQVRFSEDTLESLKRIGDSIKTFRQHDLNNANELIRRSYVVNTLYTSLSACNYYKQADECLWHARKLGYLLSLCGSNCLGGIWEWVKYTIAYRFFGGGIRLGRLLLNYLISTFVFSILLLVAAICTEIYFLPAWRQVDWSTLGNAFDRVELWDILYLAVVSILNINQSLLGCEGLRSQIDAWGWPIVVVMTIGNAYGLVLLAVFMAAIVRKMVR